ncbi:ABC transporter permease [Neglectibacter caecimuris]|uniref:ABC transporter permease n=1 Tax=Neglectibacter caecimuris TaxID=3093658 RepID=UPI002AC9AA61|nr:ABC transporter permease [Neglectibacter sp. M00184]
MKNGFKQLFRRPVRVALFFFLMTAASMLLIFGAAMYLQNAIRLQKLDEVFITVGTVEQPLLSTEYVNVGGECVSSGYTVQNYGELVSPQELEFPGADYVIPPEQRPFYLAHLPESTVAIQPNYSSILEFKALESSQTGGKAKVVITKVLLDGQVKAEEEYYDYAKTEPLKVGEEITVCQHELEGALSIEAGKTYIGCLEKKAPPLDLDFLPDFTTMSPEEVLAWQEHFQNQAGWQEPNLEFSPAAGPFTTQCDPSGKKLSTSYYPAGLNGTAYRLEEVTEGFYEEGGHGQDWLALQKQMEISHQMYPVLAVIDPGLVPSFQESNVHVRGRMITEEEYASGAKVCMVSRTFAQKNLLGVGDKIKLPLLCAMYGYQPDTEYYYVHNREDPCGTWFKLPETCSLLNTQGELYKPFWEEEYEIVGVFNVRFPKKDLPFNNMLIIPKSSVGASDENNIAYFGPMNENMTSFQLPSGSLENFQEGLQKYVPQASQLTIKYNDMGYASAAESLRSIEKTSLLLLIAGLLASAAVVALLLFFFVVREKKRTAIERSLGLSKRRCRVSLLSGLLLLTLFATALGSACAGVLISKTETLQQMEAIAEEVEGPDGEMITKPVTNWDLGGLYHFSASYSPWAMWDVKGNQAKLEEIGVPPFLYFAAPTLLCLLVGALSLLLIDRNLKIEPIALLSSKME